MLYTCIYVFIHVCIYFYFCPFVSTHVLYRWSIGICVYLTSAVYALVQITLRSPSGTNSTLIGTRPYDITSTGFSDWPFMSVHFWGENPAGNWTFFIKNANYYSLSGTVYKHLLKLTTSCTEMHSSWFFAFSTFC